MTEIALGELTPVDLRDVFRGEASHFTPWLAQEKNLVLLGNTIGLDLELVGIEQNVGPYRADIVCQDTVTGETVLVENQLEKTDHTHLGQILTYTAKFDAVTIVWIASRFTEEHRAALDWLNNHTTSNIQFFGLEVELWRIGNSPPAPKFNIVSKPNDWVKVAAQGRPDSGDLSETRQWQLAYWQTFHEYIEAQKSNRIVPRKARPRHVARYAVGRSGFSLDAVVKERERVIGVTLVLRGEDAKDYFHQLQDEKSAIEAEIEFPLLWEEKPDAQTSYISIYRNQTDPADRSDWPHQHEWLLSALEALHRTFADRVRDLEPIASPIE